MKAQSNTARVFPTKTQAASAELGLEPLGSRESAAAGSEAYQPPLPAAAPPFIPAGDAFAAVVLKIKPPFGVAS